MSANFFQEFFTEGEVCDYYYRICSIILPEFQYDGHCSYFLISCSYLKDTSFRAYSSFLSWMFSNRNAVELALFGFICQHCVKRFSSHTSGIMLLVAMCSRLKVFYRSWNTSELKVFSTVCDCTVCFPVCLCYFSVLVSVATLLVLFGLH